MRTRIAAVVAVLIAPLFAVPLAAQAPVTLKTTEFGSGPTVVLVHGLGGARLQWMPTARKLIMNELVLGVVGRALPYMFQIGLTEMVSLAPGSPPQFLHQDQSALGPYPFDRDYELMITTIWAISDFTEETGATRFVPESHNLGPWQDLTQAEVDVAIQTARLNTAVWGVLTESQRAQLTKLRAERQAGGGRERK